MKLLSVFLAFLLTGCPSLTPGQRAAGKAVVAQVRPVAAAWWQFLLLKVPQAPLPPPAKTGTAK